MSKQGTLLSVAQNQEGERPLIVTKKYPLPVTPLEHLTTFTEEYTADAGGDIAPTIIVTPLVPGGSLGIHSVYVSSDGSSGTISLDFLTSSKKIIRAYISKESRARGVDAHIEGASDESVTFQASGIGNASKAFVIISYVDHEEYVS